MPYCVSPISELGAPAGQLLLLEVGLPHAEVLLQLDRQPAVDGQRVPRDELGLRRAQEAYAIGDIERLAVGSAGVLVLEDW